MTKLSKILLSIPPVLGLFFVITFSFPQEFRWLTPTMDVYCAQIIILQSLTIIQLIILIKKVWSFDNIDKSKKKNWTWILILFNSIASLIFIWKKIDEFEK